MRWPACKPPFRPRADVRDGLTPGLRRFPAVWYEYATNRGRMRGHFFFISRVFSVASLVATACILIPDTALTQRASDPDNPFVGTWKLNRAKSTFDPGPAPARRTMKFQLAANGGLTHIMGSVTNNGRGSEEGVRVVVYTAKFDGKDTAIEGSPLGTVSLRRTGPRSVERTGKINGRVVETQTWMVSRDGKVMTITTKGSNDGIRYSSVQVYDRR